MVPKQCGGEPSTWALAAYYLIKPHETYVLRSSGLLCTLIENLPPVKSLSFLPLSTVTDLPLSSGLSGASGAGFSFVHVPAWMCVGCAFAGAPLIVTSTLTPLGSCVSVA